MSVINQQNNPRELLDKISFQYGISSDDLNLLAEADNNFIYEFSQNGKEFILRAGTRHTEELINAEIEWILFLNDTGVKVSIPVLSNNKNYHEQVKHDGIIYSIVVFEKAPGGKVDLKNPEEWNEQFWETMGGVMGDLHQASVQYNNLKPKFRRPMYYEDEYIDLAAQIFSKNDAIIIKKVDDLLQQFEQLPKDPDAFGVIHTDLHTDNFHKDGNDMIIFDWDDSYYFFFTYDLAAAFHETIWDNPLDKRQQFADRFIPAFWKGYSRKYPLDRKWLAYLPQFFKWREFIIYAFLIKEIAKEDLTDRYKSFLTRCITEFRNWLVNDTQIVNIPADLTKWFPY